MNAVRAAALELLLFHHPALLSADEVVRLLALDAGRFDERDAIDEAVGELVAAGLAHRLGGFVFASHAAVSARRFEAV